MEICKICIASGYAVSEMTISDLTEVPGMIVFPLRNYYGDFGWIIYLFREHEKQLDLRYVPKELKSIIEYATEHRYEVIYLESGRNDVSCGETKMLTLSTGHISQHTADYLLESSKLPIFKKGEYGWFIYLIFDIEIEETMPADVLQLIKFARSYGVGVLCLDCDGEIEDNLPSYEW